MARDAQWFFSRATSALRDAHKLRNSGGEEPHVLFLAHRAEEMALKAALVAKGLWDGESVHLRVHDLARLRGELASGGVKVPQAIDRDITDTATVPLTAQGACESSVQVWYEDRVDWGHIQVESRLEAAGRVVEYAARQFGFAGHWEAQ